jgi:predicted nucleotidyltransferase
VLVNEMSEKERLDTIRDAIAETLQENRIGKFNIYLFGSRARGVGKDDSDYDIMVVTHREFSGKERFDLLRKIRRNIKYLGLSIDVILKSNREYRHSKNSFGSFIYSIQNELVAI